jgi:MoaA/NifB/PqqE/SkfB family radical SAM enzyme
MDERYSNRRRIESALKFPINRLGGYPVLLNIEVTRRCNARCDFCRYWRTKTEDRLDDYVPVIRRLKPTMVMLTGGEALLRRDLEQIVRAIRRHSRTIYIGLVTNGALLTVDRGLALWNAGLDQIAMSLDFLDERHDRARGIRGLSAHILDVAPKLVVAGVHNVAVNTVIKSDNLDQILPIVEWADATGIRVSLSTYTPVKAGNTAYNISLSQSDQLHALVGRLVDLRSRTNAITSSTYYLRRIPEFAATGFIGGCQAGRRMLTVAPNGDIQRCSESPVVCPYTSWSPRRTRPTACGACWVSCRGETQAPFVSVERVKQLAVLFSPPAQPASPPARAASPAARPASPPARPVQAASLPAGGGSPTFLPNITTL